MLAFPPRLVGIVGCLGVDLNAKVFEFLLEDFSEGQTPRDLNQLLLERDLYRRGEVTFRDMESIFLAADVLACGDRDFIERSGKRCSLENVGDCTSYPRGIRQQRSLASQGG